MMDLIASIKSIKCLFMEIINEFLIETLIGDVEMRSARECERSF